MIYAQQPLRSRRISPEVHPDRTVTFRLRAPNAKEVLVGGNFTAKPQAMTRDESGVWSLTIPPLAADVYDYTVRIARKACSAYPERRRTCGMTSLAAGRALCINNDPQLRKKNTELFTNDLLADKPEEQYASVVANPAATNKAFKLIWMATGKDDFLLEADQQFVAWLRGKDVNLSWKETEGAHTWLVWRRYLTEFAPLLFR
ncbi:MAG TPA: hypothetical protein VER03_08320 [Bryobacteraceae bacterium]|nr:hypothetical protein [Bryobacteraceae bacterium]